MFLASSNSVRNIHKRGTSLDVCKKTLAKPPSSNGHFARRDRGLLFSGEEIGRDSLLLPFSLTLRLECAILPESFSDPLTSRKRRRRPRELSVSPTDFSIKLRKRPARARWDPLPSTNAPSPLSHTYEERGAVGACEGK